MFSGLSYNLLLTLVFPRKYFISHDKNLAPLCAYEMFLLNSGFDSKIDAAGCDELSGCSNLSPPTINLTLNGYDFSGR